MRATKTPKDDTATCHRVHQQPQGNGGLDLSNSKDGPLSSITHKSGSRCGIALSATGDAAYGPDQLYSWSACHPLTWDALLLQKVQGRFSWAGRLRGEGIFSCFVFLNPASRLLCKHAVKLSHTPVTSALTHLSSLYPNPASQIHPPFYLGHTDTPSNNNIISMQKSYFHICDFL